MDGSAQPPIPIEMLSGLLDHAPSPMAVVNGPLHVVRYANPAFCRLVGKTRDDLRDKPFGEVVPVNNECLAVLDRVYRSGRSESRTEPDAPEPRAFFASYRVWPVLTDGRMAGVMLQVNETALLHERILAMNEALMVGALHQHELTAAAESLNDQLQQRERDALILIDEIAHRVKNNLQIVIGLIADKARSAPDSCIEGYNDIQTRVGAIAELYDLISHTGQGDVVAADAYLRQIGKALSASLLQDTSGISIDVAAEALDIDRKRAVPFGLLVNELATNAVRHAFPGRSGRIALGLERSGDHIELTVADNGVGLNGTTSSKTSEKHGADYVAIFVRQLGGVMTVSASSGRGTTIKVRIPAGVGQIAAG